MKSSPMTENVAAMIANRRTWEQRGQYSPLGRLMWLQTERGKIEWRALDGVQTGPDVARVMGITENLDGLILLGSLDFPPIRVNSTKPCKHCRHDCDMCGLTGKIACNGQSCGGRGWIPGSWLSCPGPGCHKETGRFNPECDVCRESAIRGQIAEHVTCAMCKGTGKVVCQRCKGALKFSTGKLNGSIDWTGPSCRYCNGCGFAGKWVAQDVRRLTNALVTGPARKVWACIGPIYALALMNFETNRPQVLQIRADAEGDYLFLLTPKVRGTGGRRKGFLLGGLVAPERAAVGA